MMITPIVLCASALMLGTPHEGGHADQPQTAQKVELNATPDATQSDTPPAETPAAPSTEDANAGEPQAPAQPEPEEKVVDGVKLAAIEANLVSYTNNERAQYGLPPLEVDKELMETAREHAAWMTRTRNMVHTVRAVAENIAMGQPDSQNVVRAWMNSPGHRANILNAGHRHIGVAAFRTEEGTIFWCQQFQQ
jgi:uncharacterized protein YkwD